MNNNRNFSIVFALVIIAGLTSVSFSQYTSPRVQLESGIAPEDVQCRDDRILVLRTNGSPACVTEKTAEKMGWEIIGIVKIQSTPVISEIIVEERIPNPTGYWTPIPEEDRKEFVMKFTNAAGDYMVGEIDEIGKYKTNRGEILIGHKAIYKLYNLNLLEPQQQKKFIKDFMYSMGFEYDIENIKIHDSNSYILYNYSNEYSGISFKFPKYMNEIKISFNGWINNPELVVFPLSEELALEKALVLTNDLYSSGECGDVEPYESPYVRKYVTDGFPFYEIDTSACWNELSNSGLMVCWVSVSINAMNQTDSSYRVQCYDG